MCGATSRLLSCDKSQSSGGEAAGEETCDTKFLWSLCVLADEGVQAELPLHLLPFRCLLLKTDSAPKQY